MNSLSKKTMIEKSDQTKIVKNDHQSVIVTWSNAKGPKRYDLNCYFIPDVVRVKCALVPEQEAITLDYTFIPMYGDIGVTSINWLSVSNVFQVTTNALPSPIFCGLGQTYNESKLFINEARRNFQGSFDVNVENISAGGVGLSLDSLLLEFEFIRYADT